MAANLAAFTDMYGTKNGWWLFYDNRASGSSLTAGVVFGRKSGSSVASRASASGKQTIQLSL